MVGSYEDEDSNVVVLTPELVQTTAQFVTATASLYHQEGESAFKQLLHLYYLNLLDHMPKIRFGVVSNFFGDSEEGSSESKTEQGACLCAA